MEGRVQIRCAECGTTREVSGEIPRDYIECFAKIVREDGFAPRPGVPAFALICGSCLKNYEGHESVDDGVKINTQDPRKQG
jgi:hypothetical protein